MTEICPACGFLGPEGGPIHAYMSPSAACWAQYGEVLAREYQDRTYWRSHRLFTDAYCGQHSIGSDRRARQSLHVHLAALLLHFDDAAPEDRIVAFLRRAAGADEPFPGLEMPTDSLGIKIDAIHRAASAEEHAAAVTGYARKVYDAWSPYHATFRALVERHVA